MNLEPGAVCSLQHGRRFADNRRYTGLSSEWGDDHVSVGFELSEGDCDAAALDV